LLADLTSGEDARAEASVPALSRHGNAAVKGLQALLADSRAEIRWWAIRALAEIPQKDARSALLQSLADSDEGVRQCAALGLRENPTPRAISPLIEALASDDRLLARLAANALAAVGQPAVSPLAQAAGSEDPCVRIEAVRALAKMEHPDAVGALFGAIDDPSTVVRHWAEDGLDRLGVGMSFFRP
jgi:HEAT repeat protein